MGEIRRAGRASPLRKRLFAKWRARVVVAAPCAAAMCLDGTALDSGYLPSVANYRQTKTPKTMNR